MQVPFLDLKIQYRQIEHELKPILENIMANGAFIGGPEVAAFEDEFAAFCGGGHLRRDELRHRRAALCHDGVRRRAGG